MALRPGASASTQATRAIGRLLHGRPASKTAWLAQCRDARARSSAEEHYLDMVGVTGSIPVAPTIFVDFEYFGIIRQPRYFGAVPLKCFHASGEAGK